MTAGQQQHGRECTCGSGTRGTCDTCGAEAWIKHHCPFPCDVDSDGRIR